MTGKLRPLIAAICLLIVFIAFSSNYKISIEKLDTKPSHRLSLDSCKPNVHSICFFGKRFCHPGYTGTECNKKLIPANQYYTDCPNLKQDITFDINMPLEMFQTKDFCHTSEKHKIINGITACANLCFSHPISGVPQVPMAFWKKVQQNEANVWKGWGAGSDRGQEHLEGFDNYTLVPSRFLAVKIC
jgi:hypothetical protein